MEVLPRRNPGITGDPNPEIVARHEVGANNGVTKLGLDGGEQRFAGLIRLGDDVVLGGGLSR